MAVAGSVISAVLEPAINKLGSAIVEELGLLWGVKDELGKLSDLLSTIQAVLQDAEERKVNSPIVENWLRKLKGVAYDAHDVLDEFATEALLLKVKAENQTRKTKWVCNLSLPHFCSCPVIFRHKIAYKIKEIRKRLDEIAKERHDLHLREGDGGRRPEFEIRERRVSTSLIDTVESIVFGRENDKEKLINLLASDGSGGTEVSVIPIVGMGGLGKTTLAQLVYNDEIVKKQFELTAWVCVSENFDLKKIIKDIIQCAGNIAPAYEHLDSLVKQLQGIFSGKKFLLVLDDVWSEDRNDWYKLRAPLRCGAKGSKIIVTTRSEKVSDIMGTVTAHCLPGLSDEDCLLLFKKRAFADGSWDTHNNLQEIGMKIVKKCGGLPLAVNTLGGLLESTREVREWDDILNSEIWQLPQGPNDVLPALKLSYHHLPFYLKQCFAFCAIFPKDHEFDHAKLVKMWMGADFIRPEGQKQMEDIGRGYFNDLLWRSFFQDTGKRDVYNNKKLYKMHDLIHDLAESVSEGECFRIKDENSFQFSEKARYLSLDCHIYGPTIFDTFYKCKSLSTLVRVTNGPVRLIPDITFQKFRCLRVLDLSWTRIATLPDSIGNLKLLRYLDLSSSSIERLPESVSSLYNLQTLNLIFCCQLCELPKDMRNLINLRHLDFGGSWVSMMPLGIGRLTCLQTLSEFMVGEENGNGIGELKELNNLRGQLRISQLQNVVNAKDAELKNKQYIDKLVLKWDNEVVDLRDTRIKEEILESLQPHSNLKDLTIIGYGGECFPSRMIEPSLSNLVTIKLDGCRSCKILPPLGQLRFLKLLYIDDMEVKKVSREFCGHGMVRAFPLLERLEIISLSKLEEWSGVEEGDFPNLRFLCIENCVSLTALPRLTALRELTMLGCKDNILSSLPSLTSLSTLQIFWSKTLEEIPNGLLRSLTTLENLTIGCCYALVSLGEDEEWTHHVSLKSLLISHCPELTALPDEGLPRTLEDLQLVVLDKLTSLPEGFKNLASLRRLIINCCRKLETLPKEGLPITLQVLYIDECPLLAKRCRKDCGEDWQKISCIPDIRIDGEDWQKISCIPDIRIDNERISSN